MLELEMVCLFWYITILTFYFQFLLKFHLQNIQHSLLVNLLRIHLFKPPVKCLLIQMYMCNLLTILCLKYNHHMLQFKLYIHYNYSNFQNNIWYCPIIILLYNIILYLYYYISNNFVLSDIFHFLQMKYTTWLSTK